MLAVLSTTTFDEALRTVLDAEPTRGATLSERTPFV